MIAHASHRGDFALQQLNEVLRTMSFNIVEDAFVRVGLLGKPADAQIACLHQAVESGTLTRALAALCAASSPPSLA